MLWFSLGIIHIFAVEGHDVVEHALSLHSRTIGVQFYRLNVAVDGLMPQALFTERITLLVIRFGIWFLALGFGHGANS